VVDVLLLRADDHAGLMSAEEKLGQPMTRRKGTT